MFDHVVLGVSNYQEAKAFFIKALAPLGVEIFSEGPLGLELGRPDSQSSLCIRRIEEKATHLHLAFTADSRQLVQDFYRAALEAGAKDNGAPGLRPQYSGNYYPAFVIGPDGHNVEAVFPEPSA
jgi:catechol 2,3-dioxygenase-like lactoylglutathione lyase family enzyme